MWTRVCHAVARLRALLGGSSLDRDLTEELNAHRAALAEEHVRRGMTPAEAERQARLTLGAATQLREAHRETRGLPLIETTWQDLKYAIRTLRRSPAFVVFATLVVGLGIGASSTVFSVVGAILIQPLPFREPSRLVWLANEKSVPDLTTQVGYLQGLREHATSISNFGGYFAYGGAGDSKLTGDGEPERLTSVPVSQDFFPVLGVHTQLGRLFSAEECRWNGPKAVLLSDAVWKRRFAADPGVVGRRITINDTPITVVGVLPASFDFAAVFKPGSTVDLFVPYPLAPETHRWGNTLAVVGRLTSGATLQHAQAEVDTITTQMHREHPDWNGFSPRLSLLEQHVSGRFRAALFVLAWAVGALMLLVCANLSNLLLARTATRQKEMALRVALGAGRGRLMRQLLTESVLLSLVGAALGLILAVLGTRLVSGLDAFSIPLLGRVHIDTVALGFTIALAVVTGLLFGVIPALQVQTGAVQDALKESTRSSSGSRKYAWIRDALVVAEIAFACVLLVGAGLLIRSFQHVLDVDPGFRPAGLAELRVDPSSHYSTNDARVTYYNDLLQLVRSIPGIQGAGLTDVLPLDGDRSWGVAGKGQVYRREDYPEAFVRIVSDGYLETMGVPLIAGREFTAQDTASSEKVIVINQSLARWLWPGQNAVGQVVTQDGGRRVVGVVGDVRHLALEQSGGAEMYLPIRQTTDYSQVLLVVRTTLAPAVLASSVRAILAPLEPNLAGKQFRPIQELVDKAVSPRRFVVVLLAGFSTFALILASLGIYAVVAYSVSQRTKEFGIRMALGESIGGLRTRIILQTLRLAATGIVIGGAAAWVVARALGGLLFGVTSADPLTFVAMAIALAAVAAIAGYLPARRASRTDPMLALRAE